MKGIVLAGGSGTRLFPITKGVSKQLLPIYDKPMIYYPISILMLAGIKDILIISTTDDLESYKRLLGDGVDFGINLTYQAQSTPDGIAQSFILGESFIGDQNVCLILGDNIFYGQSLTPKLYSGIKNADKGLGATIFGYQVNDPSRFGVIEFNNDNKVISIEEKPDNPKSNYAITGLYFYDNSVVEFAKQIKPSSRGELEITSLNQIYLEKHMLNIEILGRGYAWLDTGTHASLLEASQFVETIEKRQGFKIACLEEIAFNHNWITVSDIEKSAKKMSKSDYGKYLIKLIS